MPKNIWRVMNNDYFLIIFSLFLCFSVLRYSSLNISNIVITDPQKDTLTNSSTFITSGEKGLYTFSGNIKFNALSQRYVRLMVDDCLEKLTINNTVIQIPISSSNTVCIGDGFVDLDFSKYLQMGNNEVIFTIRNDGGDVMLSLLNSSKDIRYMIYISLLFIHFGFLIYKILQRFKVGKILIFILLLSTALRFWYMSYTPFIIRNHDASSHLQYIWHIFDKNTLPEADSCYECHQKPIYYIISSFVVSISNIFHIQDPISLLQSINIIYFLFLSIIVAFLLKNLWKESFITSTCFAMFCFWPSGIIHSSRITNDILYYLSYGFTFLLLHQYITQYEKYKIRLYFVLAVLSAILSVYVKINAIVCFPLIIGAYLLKNGFFSSIRNKKIYLLFFLLISILILVFIPYIRQKNDRSLLSRITKSDMIGGGLKTGNSLSNFIYFNPRIFLSSAFVSPWEDATGRQYVWNYFLKSSLFGEFSFNTAINILIARILSYLLLSILIFGFSGIVISKSADKKSILFVLLSIILLLGIFIFYRINFPASCNTDFRYIFPILISFMLLYSYTLSSFQYVNKKILFYIGLIQVWIFIIFSISFFIIYPFYTKIP